MMWGEATYGRTSRRFAIAPGLSGRMHRNSFLAGADMVREKKRCCCWTEDGESKGCRWCWGTGRRDEKEKEE
jgi:hypothetical protein